MELLTAAQMRAVEQAAIARGQVTGLELMERAGQGVVDAVFAAWPALGAGAHRAVVLCGPGNNGGDGFVIARLLAARGWAVEVFLYGDPAKLPPDAMANLARWCELGPVAPLHAHQGQWRCDLVVDALFGTGLSRGVSGLSDLFRQMEEKVACGRVAPGHAQGRPAIVAVDLPSGLCSDSGRVLSGEGRPAAAAAHLTVSFHAQKVGHVLADGPARCGKTVIASIGLGEASGPGNAAEGSPAGPRDEIVRLAGPPCADRLTKQLGGHKYVHGHALILSGGVGKGGAARLAARGALRIGAGLATLGAPPAALIENAAQLDAVMLRPVADAAALAKLLEDCRITALCLGPGLGLERARALVPVALASQPAPPETTPGADGRAAAGPGRALLLDADALTAFADDPGALFAQLHPACVLTPHLGEFARLFPDLAAKLDAPAQAGPAYSKVDAVRAAAARAGCTLLLKGADTVIATPQGAARIHAAVHLLFNLCSQFSTT
ncbi:MAG: NAD(P)H-hydrate epimerase, partial [Pseudomonadota bacterium]